MSNTEKDNDLLIHCEKYIPLLEARCKTQEAMLIGNITDKKDDVAKKLLQNYKDLDYLVVVREAILTMRCRGTF